jgi:hypothetical protein
MKIIYIYLSIVFLSGLMACNTNSENELKIIGLRHHKIENKDDLLFTIYSSDLLCVDWANQSFQLKKEAIERIKNSKFTGGYINEYVKILFKGKDLTNVNIYNNSSSSHHFTQGSPNLFVFKSTNNIYTADNWLILNPINSNNDSIHLKLYSEELFYHLKSLGLIKGISWECDDVNSNSLQMNKPNVNFKIDFNNKFKDDIIK